MTDFKVIGKFTEKYECSDGDIDIAVVVFDDEIVLDIHREYGIGSLAISITPQHVKDLHTYLGEALKLLSIDHKNF